MDKFIIELQSLGLNNPTTVFANDRILTTQGLDIKTLCKMWRQYYKIPRLQKIELQMSTKLFNNIQKKSALPNIKSVKELFEEFGVICVEIEENNGG